MGDFKNGIKPKGEHYNSNISQSKSTRKSINKDKFDEEIDKDGWSIGELADQSTKNSLVN